MTINKKFFTNKKNIAIAFVVGTALAVGGSVVATSIGTNLSVGGTATVTGVSTFTGSATLNGGLTASGSTANDFSGSTGTFLTSTGAVTIGTGAVTVSGATTHSSTLAIGSSGTALTQVLTGTCNALIPNQSVAATSTVNVDCAVSNVVSGDKVFIQLPPNATSTLNATSTNGGWIFMGAKASTTDGYIQMTFQNRIGQATQIPNCGNVAANAPVCGTTIASGPLASVQIGLGSSTQYWIVR